MQDACFTYRDYEFLAGFLDKMIERAQELPVCDLIAISEFAGGTMPADMTDQEAKEGIDIVLNDIKRIRRKIKLMSGV